MFLEGYKRNWLHTEGFSFEDRMIDDLSVSFEQSCHFYLFFSWCLSPVNFPFTPESNGARGRGWGGGEGNKARSPSSADFTLQSYGSNRKEVRLKQHRSAEVKVGGLEPHGCAKFITNYVFFCFYSSKLDTDHLYMAYADIMAKVRHHDGFQMLVNFKLFTWLRLCFCFFFFFFRVATLMTKMKGERIWWKTLKMRCPLRCDSQNW